MNPPLLSSFETAKAGGNVVFGRDCQIASSVVIGDNVMIEHDCQIYPGVVIGDNVTIEHDCQIYPGVVIEGNVIIEDNTKIGAFTHIGKNTKIERFSTVGSHVLIGDNVLICGYAIIGGDSFDIAKPLDRTNDEDDVFFLTISNGVKIEPRATIGSYPDKNMTTFIGENVVIFANAYIRPGVYIGAQSELMPFCYLDQSCTLQGNNKLGAQTTVGGEAVLEKHVCGFNNCIFKNKTTYKCFTKPQPSYYGFDCNSYYGLDAKPMSSIIEDRRKGKV